MQLLDLGQNAGPVLGRGPWLDLLGGDGELLRRLAAGKLPDRRRRRRPRKPICRFLSRRLRSFQTSKMHSFAWRWEGLRSTGPSLRAGRWPLPASLKHAELAGQRGWGRLRGLRVQLSFVNAPEVLAAAVLNHGVQFLAAEQPADRYDLQAWGALGDFVSQAAPVIACRLLRSGSWSIARCSQAKAGRPSPAFDRGSSSSVRR